MCGEGGEEGGSGCLSSLLFCPSLCHLGKVKLKGRLVGQAVGSIGAEEEEAVTVLPTSCPPAQHGAWHVNDKNSC